MARGVRVTWALTCMDCARITWKLPHVMYSKQSIVAPIHEPSAPCAASRQEPHPATTLQRQPQHGGMAETSSGRGVKRAATMANTGSSKARSTAILVHAASNASQQIAIGVCARGLCPVQLRSGEAKGSGSVPATGGAGAEGGAYVRRAGAYREGDEDSAEGRVLGQHRPWELELARVCVLQLPR